MKLFVIAALCIAAASAARLENTYLPPNSAKTAGGSGSFLNAPKTGGSFAAQGHQAQASYSSGPTAAPIGIIRLNNENNGDGTYQFDFETENRITAQESGQVKNAPEGEGAAVQGSFSYVGDDGQTYSISYVADENGFRPEGAHLPQAPAIPEEIQKALAQNAADEAAGIVDDGQYRPEHQGPAGGQGQQQGGYSGNAAASRQYLAPKPSGQQGGYKY